MPTSRQRLSAAALGRVLLVATTLPEPAVADPMHAMVISVGRYGDALVRSLAVNGSLPQAELFPAVDYTGEGNATAEALQAYHQGLISLGSLLDLLEGRSRHRHLGALGALGVHLSHRRA